MALLSHGAGSPAQNTPGHCRRSFPDSLNVDLEFSLDPSRALQQNRLQVIPPKGLLVTGNSGVGRQGLHDSRVELRQQGQQLAADAVAGIAKVLIARVLPPWFLLYLQPVQKGAAAHVKKRPDDFAFHYRIGAGQSARACAAQQAVQHRFRLIVGGMSHCYPVRLPGFGQRKQEAITQLAGLSFQIGSGRAGGAPDIGVF